ncbi:jg20445 [Pararge aegeria aegeria]|uniref:Jg20445 protein n=1 Tax=Pararge aegeria aegeria TaxID=348720 RepID=A0A8S4RVF4_9NEOP|nr:jg20445 [Pararge aegeria aegeria]
MADHILQGGTQHWIELHDPKVLSTDRHYIPRLVREAIEIRKYNNFNREDGFKLASVWYPVSRRRLPSESESEPIPLGEDSAGELVLTALIHLLNSPRRRDIRVYLRPWDDSRLINAKAKQPHNDGECNEVGNHSSRDDLLELGKGGTGAFLGDPGASHYVLRLATEGD